MATFNRFNQVGRLQIHCHTSNDKLRCAGIVGPKNRLHFDLTR